MKLNTSQKTLLRIIGLQMVGYIMLEVIAAFLLYAGILPSFLDTTFDGDIIVKINTAYLMMVGLVAVLISGMWTAILVEFGFVEFKKISFKLKW